MAKILSCLLTMTSSIKRLCGPSWSLADSSRLSASCEHKLNRWQPPVYRVQKRYFNRIAASDLRVIACMSGSECLQYFDEENPRPRLLLLVA